MADLITLIEGAALAKFVGPAAEHYGKVALERAQQVGNKAMTMLAAVGREPRPVEPKLLLPLVQAAALESNPTLVEAWAALLANAADPTQRVAVQPGFAEVLRQLTPQEARLLTFIYRNTFPNAETDEVRAPAIAEDYTAIKVDSALPLLEISAIELQGYVDNLLRLRLCKIPDGTVGSDKLLHDSFLPVYRIAPTVFGYQFLQAVTPPTP
jgi:hypothetical protein